MDDKKRNNTNKAENLHSGHRQRLKERALYEGLDSFQSHQLLELLLFYALPYRDTNELAHRLLSRFGSFSGVLNADYEDLVSVEGIGPHAASLLTLMPDFFRRYHSDQAAPQPQLNTRAKIIDYAVGLFIGCDHERFYMICLDTQDRVVQAALINEGTLDQVTVYPRVVVETALRHRAKTVVLAHNHPGGALRPTAADVQLTQHIAALLAEIGITVQDHLIVAVDKYYSFQEKGLLGGA